MNHCLRIRTVATTAVQVLACHPDPAKEPAADPGWAWYREKANDAIRGSRELERATDPVHRGIVLAELAVALAHLFELAKSGDEEAKTGRTPTVPLLGPLRSELLACARFVAIEAVSNAMNLA